MTVEHLEILVEERSMEALLRAILPGIVGDLSFEIHAYEGKDSLLQRLPSRLRGYASYLPASWRILVVVDRDDDDCVDLKKQIDAMAKRAGLVTRSAARGGDWRLATRIAIEELEAWYFGDWQAVRAAYPRAAKGIAGKAAYRWPDEIAGGTWQAFERVLKPSGHFPGGLAKMRAAREIGAHMTPATNTSPSFRALVALLEELRAA